MENIDNIGKNSLEALSRENLTEQGRKRLTREIITGVIALCCLAVGLLYRYVLRGPYEVVPQLFYFLGFLIEGVPVIVTGVRGVISRNMTNSMEILVGIAIIACVFNHQLILSLLIPMILNLIHILEERSIMGGRDVIEGLKKMQQGTAVLIKDGAETEVDAKTLKAGDLISVKPGSGIPIDGSVVSGDSHVDQKSLTGEPQPAHIREGDPVYAGTVNLDGVLTVRVEKEYVDTSFSKILDLLEKSEKIETAESKLIDRFLTYYIPFVLAVAAGVSLVTGDPNKAIAILVVSCPCGHMMVSSAPMIAALSAATKRGVLIKNSKFIEDLTDINTVVFDKTGTVTRGELSLTDAVPFGGVTEAELTAAAASVAVSSTHPVSRAAAQAAEAEPASNAGEQPGGGVYGTDKNGDTVRFGKREWIAQFCEIPESFPGKELFGSVSYVSVGDRLLGCLCFGDTLRENAAEAVGDLEELGVENTVMLTGDREQAARHIGKAAGIGAVFARLLPQDKLDKIKELKEQGSVLAVGDGINDALALREANVGVAMGAMGSDLAIDSADIALMNNNLDNIPFVMRLSRRTKRIIYQNLVLSVSFSAIMIALSAFGVISALAGTILHNCGAFAVLLNSSRILKSPEEK